VTNAPLGGKITMCTAKATHALAANDVVHAQLSGIGDTTLMSVNGISALAVAGTVDKTAGSSGTSTAPSSGTAATTATPEVLLGAIGYSNTATYTPTSGYTVVGSVAVGTGGAKRTLVPQYRFTSTIGTYSASGSLSTSQSWKAALVTYK
jgi:hypothetical protein